MSKMKDWYYSVVNTPQRKSFPILTYLGVELNGDNIADSCKDGRVQYEGIKKLSERFPMNAVTTIMDLTLEAEAFGCKAEFRSENEVPMIPESIINDEKSIKELQVPAVYSGRIPENMKAVELVAENINNKPVFVNQIGPLSLAVRLYDMTDLMMALIQKPEMVHELMEKCTDFLISYAKEIKKAGADGIVSAEPAAGLLSSDHCHEFSSKYVRKLVEEVQDDDFYVIYHNCGKTVHQIDSILSTKAKGLHFGNTINMLDVMPYIPFDYIAMGNIDPSLFCSNNTEELKERTWELLSKTAQYKNFILSSGCDIPPGTPAENLDLFFNTLNKFNDKIFNVTA